MLSLPKCLNHKTKRALSITETIKLTFEWQKLKMKFFIFIIFQVSAHFAASFCEKSSCKACDYILHNHLESKRRQKRRSYCRILKRTSNCCWITLNPWWHGNQPILTQLDFQIFLAKDSLLTLIFEQTTSTDRKRPIEKKISSWRKDPIKYKLYFKLNVEFW